jgi:hypothetical protein
MKSLPLHYIEALPCAKEVYFSVLSNYKRQKTADLCKIGGSLRYFSDFISQAIRIRWPRNKLLLI